MRRLIAGAIVLLAILQLTSPPWSTSQVRVLPEHPRERMAAELAGELVAVLPGLLQQFQARRQELLAGGDGTTYPRDGVAALLDSTEAALQKQFKEPELAPLRDAIAEVFEKARRDLGLASQTALHLPAPQAVMASLRLPLEDPATSGSRLERGLADPVLDLVKDFMKKLQDRATRNELTVDLCVVSAPKEGAMVRMSARSSREDYRQKTAGRLKSLFRGKYLCTVEKRGYRTIEGKDCEVRLWDQREPVLNCDLSEGSCLVDDGWPDLCHGR